MQLEISFPPPRSEEAQQWLDRAAAAEQTFLEEYDRNDNNPYFDGDRAWEQIAEAADLPTDRDAFNLFRKLLSADVPLEVARAKTASLQQPEKFLLLKKLWHEFYDRYASHTKNIADLWAVMVGDIHPDTKKNLTRHTGQMHRPRQKKEIQQLVQDLSIENFAVMATLLQDKPWLTAVQTAASVRRVRD